MIEQANPTTEVRQLFRSLLLSVTRHWSFELARIHHRAWSDERRQVIGVDYVEFCPERATYGECLFGRSDRAFREIDRYEDLLHVGHGFPLLSEHVFEAVVQPKRFGHIFLSKLQATLNYYTPSPDRTLGTSLRAKPLRLSVKTVDLGRCAPRANLAA